MKFYLGEGVELDFGDILSKNIIVVKDEQFYHGTKQYIIRPIEFQINDVYFMMGQIVQDNPDKKIFIHHFEPLANGFYAMFFAIEQ